MGVMDDVWYVDDYSDNSQCDYCVDVCVGIDCGVDEMMTHRCVCGNECMECLGMVDADFK